MKRFETMEIREAVHVHAIIVNRARLEVPVRSLGVRVVVVERGYVSWKPSEKFPVISREIKPRSCGRGC